jgi:hypothetical protein
MANSLFSNRLRRRFHEGASLSIGWITIPNQSSVAKAEQFVSDYLTSRYSERKEDAEKRAGRPGLKAL